MPAQPAPLGDFEALCQLDRAGGEEVGLIPTMGPAVPRQCRPERIQIGELVPGSSFRSLAGGRRFTNECSPDAPPDANPSHRRQRCTSDRLSVWTLHEVSALIRDKRPIGAATPTVHACSPDSPRTLHGLSTTKCGQPLALGLQSRRATRYGGLRLDMAIGPNHNGRMRVTVQMPRIGPRREAERE